MSHGAAAATGDGAGGAPLPSTEALLKAERAKSRALLMKMVRLTRERDEAATAIDALARALRGGASAEAAAGAGSFGSGDSLGSGGDRYTGEHGSGPAAALPPHSSPGKGRPSWSPTPERSLGERLEALMTQLARVVRTAAEARAAAEAEHYARLAAEAALRAVAIPGAGAIPGAAGSILSLPASKSGSPERCMGRVRGGGGGGERRNTGGGGGGSGCASSAGGIPTGEADSAAEGIPAGRAAGSPETAGAGMGSAAAPVFFSSGVLEPA
eukprot:scaffold16942_cov118-Isochrysis_galbana.AAC.1